MNTVSMVQTISLNLKSNESQETSKTIDVRNLYLNKFKPRTIFKSV